MTPGPSKASARRSLVQPPRLLSGLGPSRIPTDTLRHLRRILCWLECILAYQRLAPERDGSWLDQSWLMNRCPRWGHPCWAQSLSFPGKTFWKEMQLSEGLTYVVLLASQTAHPHFPIAFPWERLKVLSAVAETRQWVIIGLHLPLVRFFGPS